jgi:hypothetical protein
MGDRAIRKNPASTLFKSSSETFLKYAEAFSINPKSRELLNVQTINPNDPLEEFLRRRA